MTTRHGFATVDGRRATEGLLQYDEPHAHYGALLSNIGGIQWPGRVAGFVSDGIMAPSIHCVFPGPDLSGSYLK